MNRAQRKAVKLRRKLGLHGRVDAEEVANLLGLIVKPWPLKVQEEMLMGHFISVAERLDSRWRRWVIAHAIGHNLLQMTDFIAHALLKQEEEPVPRVEDFGVQEAFSVLDHALNRRASRRDPQGIVRR